MRMIFKNAFSDIYSEESLIIHGPFKSGETTLLKALRHALISAPSRGRGVKCILLDMSTLKGYVKRYGLENGFISTCQK